MYVCVSCGSQNKELFFPYTTLTDCFDNRDLTFYCTVVTICTDSLTFNISTFCPRSVFMYCVWISEQTAVIPLYNLQLTGFYNRYLTLYSPVVTICTTSLTSNYSNSAYTVYICVLCGSQNNQRLFPYSTLTDYFL